MAAAGSRVGLVDGPMVAGDRRAAQCLAVHRSVWCVSRVVVPGDLFFLPSPSSGSLVRPRRLLRVYRPRAVILRGTSSNVVSPVSRLSFHVPRQFVRVHKYGTGAGRAGPIGITG